MGLTTHPAVDSTLPQSPGAKLKVNVCIKLVRKRNNSMRAMS